MRNPSRWMSAATILAVLGGACSSAGSPAAPLGPPMTRAQLEQVVSGCHQVANGALLDRYGASPGPQRSRTTGAAAIAGGLGTVAIFVAPIAFPPLTALIIMGAGVGTAAASAVTIKIADHDFKLKTSEALTQDPAKREVYLAALTQCLQEHGVTGHVVDTPDTPNR